MKKVFIASAIAMAMTAGTAMASQQAEIRFHGVVTEKTCDIAPEVNGNATSVVQLGTVTKGSDGEWKDFVLKAANPNDAGCTALTNTDTATISFMGALDNDGLSNDSGSATGAYAAVKAVNAKATSTAEIKKTNSSVEFDASKVTGDGFQFQAQLKASGANVTAGTYESALSYAVSYK